MNSYGSSDFQLPRPEDAEEWKSPSFSGDFYREVDNVCRGVTMPPADVHGSASFPGTFGKDFAPLDGDFYREPDDILKGMTLSGGGFQAEQAFPQFEKGGFLEPPPFGNELLSKHVGYSSTLDSKVSTERFEQGDIPPAAPTDPFFKLEVTTLYATSPVPHEIGNNLLNFLSDQVVSTVMKVRRQKYSIKADVFVDGMMCTLKIRVYSQDPGQFAIEFQRRTGDALCFNGTFQKATAYLGSQGVNLRDSQAAPVLLSFQPFQVPPLADQTIEEADLLPLLEMASLRDATWLQAESATSLGKIAAEGKPAVRTTRVFQAIGELMQTSSSDVAYPTACLVAHLAQQSEAAPLFASHGIWPRMLDKVRSQETDVKTRRQFAQALHSASQWQSGATLPQLDVASLLRDLSDTLRTQDDSEVMQHLEMAQRTLSSRVAA